MALKSMNEPTGRARYTRPIPNVDREVEQHDEGSMVLSTARRGQGLWVCEACGSSSWGHANSAPTCPTDHGDLDDEGVQG